MAKEDHVYDLESALTKLAIARQELEAAKIAVKELRPAAVITPEYQRYSAAMDLRQKRAADVAFWDRTVRARARELYEEDGEIHRIPGVEIKRTRMAIFDLATAKRYCIEHRMDLLLRVDRKAVAQALTHADPDEVQPFGTCIIWPQVAIAADLSEYL